MARILVIDDEANIRLMLRLALAAEGHAVSTAGDGAEGLEKFADGQTFDLVLLDQRMPGQQGLEVLRELKQRSPAAKVIMITAFGTVDLATTARRAGVSDFLRKPFTTTILREAVAIALASPPATSPEIDDPEFAQELPQVAVNGFRLEPATEPPRRTPEGAWEVGFVTRSSAGAAAFCRVMVPAYFVELVAAHCSRDDLGGDGNFWRRLAEEALANYLWQQATPPPDGTLVLEELTPNLRRWMEVALAAN